MKPSYTKRFDGRDWKEMRPISAKVGVVPRADGSAMFKNGDTIAYAAVYGPRDLHPKFMQNPEKGILRVHYNMMPFSGHGDRVRPGGNRRSKELGLVIKNALLPVLNLDNYPNSVVDVFIELPQTDAGTRCAGICAAAMALADAGLDMKDLVASVALGKVGGQLLVDPNYDEEAYQGEGGSTDVPMAMLPSSGKFTLLQCDGNMVPEDLKKLLEIAKDAASKIYEVQKNALKEKFMEVGQ